jgi:hypothetical protein
VTPPSVRCRVPWCWGRSVRSQALSSAIRQGPRSRVPGESIDPDRRDIAGKPRKRACVAPERKLSVEPDPRPRASKKMRGSRRPGETPATRHRPRGHRRRLRRPYRRCKHSSEFGASRRISHPYCAAACSNFVRPTVEIRSSQIQANQGTTRSANFVECGIMMTFVWAGVALWLAFNAAVAVCLLTAQPGRATHRPYHGPYQI